MTTAAATTPTSDARLRQALEAQAAYMPDVQAQIGPLADGWRTARSFFADDAAITQFLEFERSLNKGTDLKSGGAFLMGDYGYILAAAVVPLFVGFDVLPDFSPDALALSFYTAEEPHDGEMHKTRRAHVRYLSPDFAEGRLDDPAHLERFRIQAEVHFRPVVETIFARTRLSRNALWRLAADSLAGRFLDSGRRFGCVEAAKAAAMHILKQPGSPFNNPQLHYFDLTVLDKNQQDFSYTFRSRGGCCRYYLTEGGEYCPTCVLNAPKERDEALRQLMRKHLGVA